MCDSIKPGDRVHVQTSTSHYHATVRVVEGPEEGKDRKVLLAKAGLRRDVWVKYDHCTKVEKHTN